MWFLINYKCGDRGLSFFEVACLPLWRKDMNSALPYRERGRRLFWIAFVSALAIHIGAIALAKTKSPTVRLENFTPTSDVVIGYAPEPEPALQEESVTPLPLEEIHPDQDSFPEENHKPSPARPYRKARPPSLAPGTTTPLRSVKALVAYAPRPVYPYEARRQRLTGSGVALLTVDQSSGDVTDVVMVQSCGNAILDNSTRDALRRWRFRPGSLTKVQVPVTYTLMGVSY
jgi:TonB family protein